MQDKNASDNDFPVNLNRRVFCLDQRFSTTRLVTTTPPKSLRDEPTQSGSLPPSMEARQAEGGLRIKGYFKVSRPDKPLISIVTVVYNEVEGIERTIQSVIDLHYYDVEYIIIDGGSSDGTLDKIQSNNDTIDYWMS